MKSILVFLLLLLLSSSIVVAQPSASQPDPCAIPQQKQFDFWIGQWDLTWPGENGSTGHGTNNITRVLDGCVVQESFSGESSMPLRGISVSTFDAGSGMWKQTWVDNEGGYLDFVGEFKKGQMILEREATGKDGRKFRQRMVWKNISANELDWSWEASTDGGKTWQVKWPIHYRRRS